MNQLKDGNSPGVLDARCRDLLREAAQWRLISLLLSAPRRDWRSQVAMLGQEIDDPTLMEAASAAGVEAGEGLYDSTFGPGGPAPPREISYRPASLSSQYLAELAGYYSAFGYSPPYDEPVDHVAVEADFVSYLKLKEALAAHDALDERVLTVRDAVDRLVNEHLAWIAAPLSMRLAASGVRYLTHAAKSLAVRTGPPPAERAELPILVEDCGGGAAWACGDGESLYECGEQCL